LREIATAIGRPVSTVSREVAVQAPKIALIETVDMARDGVYQRWRRGTRRFLKLTWTPPPFRAERQMINIARHPSQPECP
jgi:IS30 family transposase